MSSVFNIEGRAETWMRDDLAKSGIDANDIGAEAFSGAGLIAWPNAEVPNEQGVKEPLNLSQWVSMYYTIPYWTPEGERLPSVVVRKPRFKEGAPSEVREKKYVRPSKRTAGDFAVAPYMHPGRVQQQPGILDIHEGEKKTACGVVNGQWAIGIGGCWSWGDPTIKGRLHPWIKDEIDRIQAACPGERIKVRIWPDADFLTNQNVRQGWSGFSAELRERDVDVVLMDMSSFGKDSKFDDLVHSFSYKTVMAGAKEVSTLTLPENPEALVRKYQLLASPVGKKDDAKLLPQAITENIIVLLERHPHFLDPETGTPKIWLDIDRQRPMLGKEELVENLGDTEMLRYFQRHLGFNGAGRTVTLPALREALAYQLNSHKRSPFNDRVRAAAARLRGAGPEAMAAADQALNEWTLKYLHAPDDEKGFNRRWGRKFLMSIVGRALRPGCFMRTAYVLAGPQDIGKSAFVESIVGKSNVAIIREENSKGKDLPMTYASCLVAVHDEMQAMTSRGLQSVKSDISATNDNIRLPYGRMNVDMPRRCVFLIPVDRMDFLFEDSAGMTRFAVLNLLESHSKSTRFDFAGMEAAADDLLGAAWIAVEASEVFDVVEGAEESARPHLKADLTMEQIEQVIEHAHFAERLHAGAFKGRMVIGFLLPDLVAHLPPGAKAAGGGSTVLTGPLRKLGFETTAPDVKVVGYRRLWFMDQDAFNEKFTVAKAKFDA